jgi:Phospholipase B
MRRTAAIVIVCSTILFVAAAATVKPKADDRLKGSFRRPAVNGWTVVHLEGTPAEIGFQHGYLLAPEIQDLENVYKLELTHDTGKDWNFLREAGKTVLWPHVEPEYREEMQGIADGATARGVNVDIWDVVALNAAMEWSYYVAEFDKAHKIASLPTVTAPDHCSAFVAVGSYTKDGRVVIAHNNWTSYLDGARWTMVFDVVPAKGYHFIMDGLPALIHSGDDFAVNSAGIVITETTISGFHGFDTAGIPEFVRARKAMQYSSSIDDMARIFRDGNNGGYANDWLIADTHKGEIASLELGLKNVTLERKTDGYFVGSNFPIAPKLAAEETDFATTDMSNSPNARHRRWEQLMAENKGKIDVNLAEKFLADHLDSFTGKTEPSERTLCGHVELSPRGMGSWQIPYGNAGAVQNKATDTQLAARMEFVAAAGHACGMDFLATKHLQQHPEQSWEKSELRDMKAYPWTTISAQR